MPDSRYPAAQPARGPITSLAGVTVIFLALFVMSRAYFFTDFPIPAIYPDSTSYYALVHVMRSGQWPDFSIRPPGYPLFLAAVFSVANRLMAVVVAQTLLALVAGLSCVYAAYRWRWWLAVPAAVAMGAFAVGVWPIEHDTALMSESPYVSSILFAFGFLAVGLTSRRAAWFALSSAAMAWAIMTRPAAHFFLVIYFMVLLFIWWNRYGRSIAIAFATPLAVILVALSTYNAATIGAFTTTAFGEMNIAFATFTFWESDPAYPSDINAVIARVQSDVRQHLSADDYHMLHDSWNPIRLAPVFLKGFAAQDAMADADRLGVSGKTDYHAARRWIRRISFASIGKHPKLYAKFVFTQLMLYYRYNITAEFDFTQLLEQRAATMYVQRTYTALNGLPLYVEMSKEFAGAVPPKTVTIAGTGAAARPVLESNSIPVRAHEWSVTLRQRWFATPWWVAMWLVVFAVAVVRVATTRGRHAGAFFVLVLDASVVGASLVVALVEYAGVRYSYPMEFAYYLSVALFPLLFVSDVSPSAHAAGSYSADDQTAYPTIRVGDQNI